MSDQKGCNNCGACCYLITREGVRTTTPCMYLKFNEDGTTRCKVYHRNRVGRKIGEIDGFKNRCVYREKDFNSYDGCSLNP